MLKRASRRAGQAPILTEVITDTPPPAVYLAPGSLNEGFVLRNEDEGGLRLTVLTDAELFGMARPAPKRAMRARAVAPETFFADLRPGDLVVHMEHGIAPVSYTHLKLPTSDLGEISVVAD